MTNAHYYTKANYGVFNIIKRLYLIASSLEARADILKNTKFPFKIK